MANKDPADGVRRVGRKGVEISAECRAQYGSRLPGDRGQSDGAGQDLARNKVGRECAERRAREGASNAEQGRNDV